MNLFLFHWIMLAGLLSFTRKEDLAREIELLPCLARRRAAEVPSLDTAGEAAMTNTR
jgi:hypothetical protein